MKFSDLIYDVGLHSGEDTAFYLAKGFRVLAIEANPALVEAAQLRFREAIESKRLVILSGAICQPSDSGRAFTKFYVKKGFLELGTVDVQWVDRNSIYSGEVEEIEVPVIAFRDVIAEHGIPHYMKIDVEGVDRHCVSTLGEFDERPDFLSFELEKESGAHADSDLKAMISLGYTSFKLVNQQVIPDSEISEAQQEGKRIRWRFPRSSSGAFGQDIPGGWHGVDRIACEIRSALRAYTWFGERSFCRRFKMGRYNVGSESLQFLEKIVRRPLPGWHDLHARLGGARRNDGGTSE